VGNASGGGWGSFEDLKNAPGNKFFFRGGTSYKWGGGDAACD